MHTIESVTAAGFQLGTELVACNWQDAINWDEFQDQDGEVEIDFTEWGEKIAELAWEANENYRQYSPFEFFAHELNEAENSEELWEAYDEGIYQGIEAKTNEIILNFSYKS